MSNYTNKRLPLSIKRFLGICIPKKRVHINFKGKELYNSKTDNIALIINTFYDNENCHRKANDIVSGILREPLELLSNSEFNNIAVAINESYDNKDDYKKSNSIISGSLGEPLKLLNNYCTGGKETVFGLILAKNAMVATYEFGGEFFRRQNVKRHIENKMNHKAADSDPESAHKEKHIMKSKFSRLSSGYHIKDIDLLDDILNKIYKSSSILHVDTRKGKLYVGMSLDSVLRYHSI